MLLASRLETYCLSWGNQRCFVVLVGLNYFFRCWPVACCLATRLMNTPNIQLPEVCNFVGPKSSLKTSRNRAHLFEQPLRNHWWPGPGDPPQSPGPESFSEATGAMKREADVAASRQISDIFDFGRERVNQTIRLWRRADDSISTRGSMGKPLEWSSEIRRDR